MKKKYFQNNLKAFLKLRLGQNNPCCTDQCKFRDSSKLCRKAQGACDKPEYCTGRPGTCPHNIFYNNGKNCKTNGDEGHCYSGKCVTKDGNCRKLFGSGATSSQSSKN